MEEKWSNSWEAFTQKIGKLNRTIYLYYFDWGINAVVRDRCDGEIRYRTTTRNFKLCKTSPTIGDCKERAKRYFKITNQ